MKLSETTLKKLTQTQLTSFNYKKFNNYVKKLDDYNLSKIIRKRSKNCTI